MSEAKRDLTRRGLLGLGAAAVAAGVVGCGADGRPARPGPGPGGSGPSGSAVAVRPIGDGSTADSGPQPRQPDKPVPLQPGETPPQFVVFSWDGAGEIGNGLFPRFLKLAKDHGAAMTFFLSGIYLLPESKKDLYKPPNNPAGASDIGYLKDENVRNTLKCVREAWLDGHEVGTHFNGHFCAGSGSVDHWGPDDWQSEIDQAVSFVTNWRTNTGFTDLEPLPFDYRKELVGGRTPCLLGREGLLPVAQKLGWRYDASSPGGLQVWPGKKSGIWDLPLQSLPFPGHSFEVLSMDYNILANQSKNTTRGMPSNYPAWRTQATSTYLGGFRRAYETNRAPLFIGNHFEEWNGGIYMDAVEEALKGMSDKKDVRLLSFRQFTDWLDVQDPKLLARLQELAPGQPPAGGWGAYLSAA
ncbi:hypothetical protein [Streptomyces sp. NBC_01296]|uniref:hypothetical protein n=1 Tax=Streptomyces sp. NBC_01296 TaxID=2903816 RepID=UPI002E1186FF|nr:hypothetical protein OG299_17720 [Streptomyces sp. NBC_01296]WSW61197.1 hypothetical protein OG513_22930 [Streptomyces sp. NBC_00998]